MVKGDAKVTGENDIRMANQPVPMPKIVVKIHEWNFSIINTNTIQKETPAPCRAAVLHEVIHQRRNSQQRIYQDPAQAHRTTLGHQPHGVSCYLVREWQVRVPLPLNNDGKLSVIVMIYICRYVHIKRPAFWSRSDRTPSRCVSIVRDVMCHKKHCIPTQQTLNTTGNEHGTRFGARLSCSTRYYAYSSNSPLPLTVFTGCLPIPKYRCM